MIAAAVLIAILEDQTINGNGAFAQLRNPPILVDCNPEV